MHCPACNSENRDGAKYCTDCGSPFAAKCPACGASNRAGAKFCEECGRVLSPAAPSARGAPQSRSHDVTSPSLIVETPSEPADGERKTVTALFADIRGSTELMEDLDAEEARSIVDPVLKLMIDAVRRYDGYVVQSTGDGVFALFGAPVAHEDHPQRALYAALRIQEELRRYSAKLRAEARAPIEARVGVNTGEVVVRTLTTGEGHTEYTPIGHTTNLASRMQTIAPSGGVVVSENTRKLVEGYFQLKSLGPVAVKGISEPVAVYEVSGLGPLRTRLQRSAGRGLTKFVGRQREMEALRHAAGLARPGKGQVVAAVGEAGVGKSRLFYEFKAVSQSEWMVLEAFSLSHGKATAYLPVIELLREYFRITPDDDQRTRREKVTGRVLALDRALEDTLPYLFSLLGIGEDDSLAQMDAQVRRRRTHDALKRLLLRESLNQPLMLVFEDLHWIDSETEAILNALVDSLGTARVLLLVNYRPEYSHAWTNKTCYTQLRLDPLGRETADEMLSSLLGLDTLARSVAGEGERGAEPRAGEGAESLAALKRLIIDKTEGNPFFMEEIVQALVEQGALVRNGTVRLMRPVSELRLPPTVQGILASRIDRLGSEQKALLQTLAVIGKEFPLSLVRAVVNRSDDELAPLLSALQLAEFIYEVPAAGDVEYTFKHALTQEVAFGSLLGEHRKAIHRRTAQVMEELYEEELSQHYSELARHYRHSDEAPKAVKYLNLAAGQAVARTAYAEAANNLAHALRLLDAIPSETARLRMELEIRKTENPVSAVLHGYASTERQRAIERLCELGERLGDTDALLVGLINQAIFYYPRGEPLRVLEIGRRCLELVERTGAKRLLPDACEALGLGATSAGDLRQASSHFRRGIESSSSMDRTGLTRVLPMMSVPALRSHGCLNEHLLGEISEGQRLAREGIEFANELAHPFTTGLVLTTVGWLHQCRRDLEAATQIASAAIALAEEHGFPEWLAWNRWLRGWAFVESGKADEGARLIEGAVSEMRRLGGVPRLPFVLATLAEGYARLGRLDEAIAIIDEQLQRIARTGERLDEAELRRMRAEMLLARDEGALAEAEAELHKAIDVARAQESKWYELRATTSLARLLARSGRRDEARGMLSDVYNWFTEGFELLDLKDAKALLEQLAA